jgi:hypothetical protein
MGRFGAQDSDPGDRCEGTAWRVGLTSADSGTRRARRFTVLGLDATEPDRVPTARRIEHPELRTTP